MDLVQAYPKLALISLAGSYGLVNLGFVSPYASTKLREYALAWSVLFFGMTFCIAAYRNQIYPKLLSPLRHLPGPKDNGWMHGQMKRIFKEESGEPQREWINTIPNDGVIRYLGVWNRERLLPTSAKTLQEVLTSKSYTYIKPKQFIFNLGRLLGNGLLLAEGDEHKRQRKILVPAFHHRHLITISRHFWEKSQLMGKVFTGMSAETGSTVLDVDEWASRVTLDIIGKAGFDLDFEALTNDDSLLLKTYRKVFKPTRAAMLMGILNSFLHPRLMSFLPVQRNYDIQTASVTIKKYAQQMIDEKRKLFADTENKRSDNAINKDILSVMIEDGQFSDAEMQNQLMTFLAAGHETTSSSVTWCLYALARDLNLQNKLRDDIRAHIPSLDDVNVTSEKLDSIRMLRNVCNEVLRYHAPVPMTIRTAAEDTTLNGDFVPKGTWIMISPAAVNRSTSLWGPDADSFKPERWDKEGGNGGATSNYAMLTFLMGPRSCIGQKFAVDEFKFIIAALIGRFQFELAEPDRQVRKTGFVTLRPEGGLQMKVTLVPGW